MSDLIHHGGKEYKKLFENAIEGIFQSSMGGRLLMVNPAMARIYGYDSPEDMITSIKNIDKQLYVNTQDRKKFNEELKKHGRFEGFEAQNYRKDKSIIWVQTSSHIIYDEKGKALFLEGFITEITKRKETEEALRKSEERYRALVEGNPAVIFLDSEDEFQTTVYISPNIKELLGYTPGEWMANPHIWENSIHPDDKESVLAEDKRTNQNADKFSLEYRLKRKDGNYIWVREESSIILDANGKNLYWQGFLFDISSQKQAEKTIRQSEEQFKKIFLANPIASCIATLQEGRFITANDSYWELAGFMPNEIIGHTSIELGFVDKSGREAIIQRLKKERSIHNENGRLITKSGKIRNTLEFFDIITFNGQECILSMFYDVTDKVNAQKSIQESEERFRLSFQTSPDAININRLEDGLYVDINDGFTSATGYTREDVIGKTSFEIDIWDNKQDRAELVEGLNKHGFVNNLEAKFRLKNGQIVTGLISARIITLDDTPHIISITREIETIKQTEKTLQRQLKELTILHNIAVATSSSTNRDELIGRITDIIGDMLHPDNCGVELVSKSGSTYETHQSYRGVSEKEKRKPLPLSMGITGKVITTGKSIRVGDVAQESAYVEVTRGIRSELCVPIKMQRRVIGVINIESKLTDAFDEADERLFNIIAGTLATAIEQLRLFEMSQHQLIELETLNTVANAGARATNIDDLIEEVTHIIGETLYLDNFGLLLLNATGDTLIPHPSYRGITDNEFPKSINLGQGVSGQVALSGKSLRLKNVQNHKNYIAVTSQICSELCVPIRHGEHIFGVINAESIKTDAFNENDEQLLTTIANTIATTIEKLRLFENEKKRRQEVEILLEATSALTTSLKLDTLLDSILEMLSRIVPYDTASIAIEQNEKLIIVAGKGFHPEYEVIGKQLGYSDEWILLNATRQAHIVADAQLESNFKQWEGSEYIRGWMGVPMVVHDKLIGFINLDSCEPNSFRSEDALLAQTFANSAAVAIENARLYQNALDASERRSVLHQLSQDITHTLYLDDTYRAIHDATKELMPCDAFVISLHNPSKNENIAVYLIEQDKQYPPKTIPDNQGLASEVISTGKAIIYHKIDNAKENCMYRFGSKKQVQSLLAVPMKTGSKTIGMLSAQCYLPDAYGDEEQALLEMLASHAAAAIENARLFEAEQRRHRESETLRQAALAITTSLDLENVLEAILIVMKQVVPYDSASVFLLEGDELRITAAQGFKNLDEVLNLRFPASDELFNAVRNNDEPIILRDAQQDTRFKKWADTGHIHGWMGVPLSLRNEVIGYITFDSQQEDAYNEKLSTLTQAFANQAASAIQNARQFEAEQRHSREAETLRQAAEAITSTLDIQQVLKSVLDNLNHVIPFDSASVFLIENEIVRLTAASGTALQGDFVNRTFPANNALFQEIWKTRLPLILKDVRKDSRFIKWVVDDIRGWMGVPLITRGTIIGYITIDSHKSDVYSTHDANLAITFAHQAATALENARLYERGEQQIRQLTALRDIDSAISSSFDLRVTLNLLVGHATRELNADAANILLYNADLHSLSLYTSTGFKEQSTLISSSLRIGEGLAGRVALQRKLVQVPDISKNATHHRDIAYNQQGFKSYFGVPLIGKGQIKGVLEVYTRDELHPSADWLNFLHTLAGQAAIAIDNGQLFKNLQRSNQELTLAYDTTLEGWGRALELRDKETQGHTNRVVELTIELAQRMDIGGEELTHIMRGVLLHDIGKMGVPDNILHKPEALTKEEWEIMKQHPKHAYDLMYPITYLRPALDIPYSHHERWNGKGYPQGLKGEEIPMAARIFAVIDIWDALLYERPYREAWSEDKVLEYIKNAAGVELDPNIVEKFLDLLKEEKQFRKRAE